MTVLVKLTEPLYDQRSDDRPRVFLWPAGAVIPKDLADRFGGKYAPVADAKKAEPAANKKRSPAENKKA